jgi:hypothetical protein
MTGALFVIQSSLLSRISDKVFLCILMYFNRKNLYFMNYVPTLIETVTESLDARIVLK